MLGEYLDSFGKPDVAATAQGWTDGRLLTEPVKDTAGDAYRLLVSFRFVSEKNDSRVTAVELLHADEASDRFEAFVRDKEAVRRDWREQPPSPPSDNAAD